MRRKDRGDEVYDETMRFLYICVLVSRSFVYGLCNNICGFTATHGWMEHWGGWVYPDPEDERMTGGGEEVSFIDT